MSLKILKKKPVNTCSDNCFLKVRSGICKRCFCVDLTQFLDYDNTNLRTFRLSDSELREKLFSFLIFLNNKEEETINIFLDTVFNEIGHMSQVDIVIFVVMFSIKSNDFVHIGTRGLQDNTYMNFLTMCSVKKSIGFETNLHNCLVWWEKQHFNFDSYFQILEFLVNVLLRSYLRFSSDPNKDTKRYLNYFKISFSRAMGIFFKERISTFAERIQING